MQFSYMHQKHQDPVCFRVALFTTILAFWCQNCDFMYNVNLLSKANRENNVLNKDQLQFSKVVQMFGGGVLDILNQWSSP